MILHPLYKNILKPWAEGNNKILSFIAYPLGYCIYCSSTWIAWLLYVLVCYEELSEFTYSGVVIIGGIQHVTVVIICRWLQYNHPDLDDKEDNNLIKILKVIMNRVLLLLIVIGITILVAAFVDKKERSSIEVIDTGIDTLSINLNDST